MKYHRVIIVRCVPSTHIVAIEIPSAGSVSWVLLLGGARMPGTPNRKYWDLIEFFRHSFCDGKHWQTRSHKAGRCPISSYMHVDVASTARYFLPTFALPLCVASQFNPHKAICLQKRHINIIIAISVYSPFSSLKPLDLIPLINSSIGRHGVQR